MIQPAFDVQALVSALGGDPTGTGEPTRLSAADTGPVSSGWQGAARLAEGLFSGLAAGRANAVAAANAAGGNAALGDLLGSFGRGDQSSSLAPAAPMMQTANS
ncbi:MAG: hypothetical protein ACRECZ_08310, partial [Methylocella sp.]